jgi:hypothetical protein
MSYPLYPTLRQTQTVDKLDYTTLKAIYEELTQLGLTLLPKKRTDKIPLAKYWVKLNRQEPTASNVLNDQLDTNVSGWCVKTGGGYYVIDLDTQAIREGGNDPIQVYNQLQGMSFTGFVLDTPSAGVHMYYKLPEGVEPLTNKKPRIIGVDARGEGGQVVTLGGFNRYTGTYATSKGVPDGYLQCYSKISNGDYSHIPIMSLELYNFLKEDISEANRPDSKYKQAENYGQTEEGNERVKKHFKQPLSVREEVTIECLSYVLSSWDNKDYEMWLQLWMSAHHGATTDKVRNYILDHPNIKWSDGITGKDKFIQAWQNHQHRETGYTVASLFYYARQNSWLSKTGYEITDYKEINTAFIPDWLDTLEDIPKRLCLMSQTGSGKTQALIKLYKRLNKPKTVVLVPTIKLAVELHATLEKAGLDATLYVNVNTNRPKPATELIGANLLVITLQSFSAYVWSNNMQDYGLMYIEESDQLIQGFARGGNTQYSSQVRESEAKKGFECLSDALNKCSYVWAVDATMSQITQDLFSNLAPYYETIKNLWVKSKAKVHMLSTQGEALEVILQALLSKRQVVVPCDTAGLAKDVYDIMTELTSCKSILITRETERDAKVIEFMQDVNKYAKEYDLVVYNSVIASGVSITEVNPDFIVQLCKYLSPRQNLQLLNRYREQKYVFCYYIDTENLYNMRDDYILKTYHNKAQLEALYLLLELNRRSNNATLRATLASKSIADEQAQKRSPKNFYINLLKEDGRAIVYDFEVTMSNLVSYTLEGIREAKKQKKEAIRLGWRTVPIINPKEEIPAHLSNLEVAQGITHYVIDKVLKGNIPNDVDDGKIYDVTYQFKPTSYVLSALITPDEAINKAEYYVIDDSVSIASIRNNLTLLKVAELVLELYKDLHNKLLDTNIIENAMTFLRELIAHKESYDAIIDNNRQKFLSVYDPKNPVDSALKFTKIILAKLGLEQRSERHKRNGEGYSYQYSIKNIEEAEMFLQWRMQSTDIKTISPALKAHEPISTAYKLALDNGTLNEVDLRYGLIFATREEMI